MGSRKVRRLDKWAKEQLDEMGFPAVIAPGELHAMIEERFGKGISISPADGSVIPNTTVSAKGARIVSPARDFEWYQNHECNHEYCHLLLGHNLAKATEEALAEVTPDLPLGKVLEAVTVYYRCDLDSIEEQQVEALADELSLRQQRGLRPARATSGFEKALTDG